MNRKQFFVPGFAKCGTFTLYDMLSKHPQVQMSKRKEPNFFRYSETFESGTEEYENKCFINTDSDFYYGDCSVAYSVLPEVPERIVQYYPDAKFIFLMRDPIERLISQYVYAVSQGRESRLFKRVINDIKAASDKEWYFIMSMYGKHIHHFMSYFPQENMLFLITERLKGNNNYADEICRFLDIETGHDFSLPKTSNPTYTRLGKIGYNYLKTLSNSSKLSQILGPNNLKKIVSVLQSKLPIAQKPILSEEDRAQLAAILQPDLELLKSIIGEVPVEWKSIKQ